MGFSCSLLGDTDAIGSGEARSLLVRLFDLATVALIEVDLEAVESFLLAAGEGLGECGRESSLSYCARSCPTSSICCELRAGRPSLGGCDSKQ